MKGSEDRVGEADDIPPELKPASAPDPRSLRPIANGIGMVMLSAATWQMSVAMEPAIVELWKQLLPVAPFGQLFPEFLMGPLSNLLIFEQIGSDLFIVPMLIGFAAPLLCGCGVLVLSHGTIWTALEYYRSA